MRRWLLIPFALGGIASISCNDRVCTETEGLKVYERRIEPVLSDDHPQSCNQCHLSGVDLSNFVQKTPCQTMACLEDKGLVDLDSPEDSEILTWIERAMPESELITQDVIDEEYEGFLAWIEFNADCAPGSCPDFDDPCGDAPKATDCEIPPHDFEPGPFEDPGDCSDLTLELVFREKVYAWRGRCYACHFDSYDGEPKEAPRWIATGSCDEGSLKTLRNVLERGFVDLEDPTQSRMLLKPLAEDEGGIMHGGATKFADKMDPAYQSFLYWIERYATCNAP